MLRGRLTRAALAHRAWRYRLRVDPDGIRWMRSALRPGDIAVDVGAYRGGYTYWMRRGVGESGAVLAYEPQPGPAAYLRRCVRDCAWSNVTVVGCALSSQPGRRTLRLPGDAPSPAGSLVGASLPIGSRGHDVDVETLDRYLAANLLPSGPRLVKCDVEGHELEVFLGARATLEEHRPSILVECEARHAPDRAVEDVFEHLLALGYRGSFFWRGVRTDVGRFETELHQVEGRRPYVNNFIFEPSES